MATANRQAASSRAPKPKPPASKKPTLPDLRKVVPRQDANGLVLLAYDPARNTITAVTVEGVLKMLPWPNPHPIPPNTEDDLPIATDGGDAIATDGGQVLVGDTR